MSRYIDIDKLSKMIEARAETLVEGKEAFYYIANWLNKLPPADVAEIVRCKDCKYFEEEQRKNHQGVCMCGEKDTTHASEFYPYADDFCSYGERKDEE